MHISLSASRISGREAPHRRPTQTAASCWLVFLLAAFGAVASAQSTVKDTKAADYSKEPLVYELISTQIVFENDGTESGQTTARMRIQSQAGVQRGGVLDFPYASSTSTMDI